MFCARNRFLVRRTLDISSAGIRHLSRSSLDAIFKPRSVAVIGATDRPASVGRTVVKNLLQASQNISVFPINPARKTVQNTKCYPNLEAIPRSSPVDLAVVVTPAKSCVDVLKQCSAQGVRAAIVISAGFKESGSEGAAMEQQLLEVGRESRIRIIGPNCLGVMSPFTGLNATFAAAMANAGPLAFISQSGAMCTAVLDWSLKQKVGFSAFVSIGSMADVDWADIVEYLGKDGNTRCILMYIESLGDNVERFIEAARKVAPHKPLIALKAGKSSQAAKAAASHTGSLVGSYEAFEAAMERAGVVTVDSVRELYHWAQFLGKQPPPRGPNLVIVTNAGGPGVLATDAAVQAGARIEDLPAETVRQLDSFLPAAWSHGNPVDLLGDASPTAYAKSLPLVLGSRETDGVLLVLSPQDVTDPTGTAQRVIEELSQVKKGKPVLASWMGGDAVAAGATLLTEAGIPTFENPDEAATIYGKIWQKSSQAKEISVATTGQKAVQHHIRTLSESVESILETARQQNLSLLTEEQSKRILQSYDIPTVPTLLATTNREARRVAKSMGCSEFVAKLNSSTLSHKSDVGGVLLHLGPKEVAPAFKKIKSAVTKAHGAQHFQGITVQPMIKMQKALELILGSSTDPRFGPLLLFGSGGIMVEVFKDTAIAYPPLDNKQAERLIRKTRIFKALTGEKERFPAVDIAELANILVKFSHMVVDLKAYISECDVNPFLVSSEKMLALDARFALKQNPTRAK